MSTTGIDLDRDYTRRTYFREYRRRKRAEEKAAMTERDELAAAILAIFLAPYGEYITPALRRQFTICARQAAEVWHKRQAEREPARTVKVTPMRKAG